MSWISRARQNLALTIGGGGGGGLGVGVALYIVVAAIFGGDAVGMCDHPLGIDGVQLKVRCPAEATPTPTPTLSPSPTLTPVATAVPTPTPEPDVILKNPEDGQEVVLGTTEAMVEGQVRADLNCPFLYVGFVVVEGDRIDNRIYPQGPLIVTAQEFTWGILQPAGIYDLYLLCVSEEKHQQWKQGRTDLESGDTAIKSIPSEGEPGVENLLRITVTLIQPLSSLP